MPSDIILDSLCAEGIARKTIQPVPSLKPEYPYKSLGTRHDTVFYNTATQYTIDLLILQNDATTVVLKPGKGQKQPEVLPPTVIERLIAWYQSIDWYTQNGGIPFTSSFGSGNAGPYRARYPDQPVNIDWLLAIFGALSLGRSAGLEVANGLSNLFDGLNNLNNGPYTSGQGPLKPEEYEAGMETERDGTANKKKESITVPPKPNQFPTGNTPASDSNYAQRLTIEVTIPPAKDTIHLANKDSSSNERLLDEVHRINSRDTIYKNVYTNKAAIQYEKLVRQDTVYHINIHLTPDGIIYKDYLTGDPMSKQKYEEIKRSE